jgi:hypothetical protein
MKIHWAFEGVFFCFDGVSYIDAQLEINFSTQLKNDLSMKKKIAKDHDPILNTKW